MKEMINDKTVVRKPAGKLPEGKRQKQMGGEYCRMNLTYQLLLLGFVEQSIPSTSATFCPIVFSHLVSNTPDSSTSALWLHQRHLVVTQGGGKKCP
jgi:hypothetical protein